MASPSIKRIDSLGAAAAAADDDKTVVGQGNILKRSTRLLDAQYVQSVLELSGLPVTATGSTTARSLADRASDLQSVKNWGVVGDGSTDDYANFQAAIEASATGGFTLLVPHTTTYYRIKRALLARSGASIWVPNPATRIVCTGDAAGGFGQWPSYGAIMLGSYSGGNAGNIERAPTYPINNFTAGASSITTTTASNGGLFVDGDIVLVYTDADYDSGFDDNMPTWMQMNVVSGTPSGATGVIPLRHPLDATKTTVHVRRLSNTGSTWLRADATNSAEALFAVRDFSLVGGTWETTVNEGPFSGTGGIIDSVVAPHGAKCFSGIGYGNLMCRSKFSAVYQLVRHHACEFAHGSHDFELDVLSTSCVGTVSPEAIAWTNESTRNGKIRLHKVNAGTWAPKCGIKINQSTNVDIEIGELIGGAFSEAVLRLDDLAHTGTRPVLTDNRLCIRNARPTSQVDNVIVTGGVAPQNNKIEGRIYGTPSTDNSVFLEKSINNEFALWCEAGNLLYGAAADCYDNFGFISVPGDVATDASLTQARNNDLDIRSTAARQGRALARSLLISVTGGAAADVQTISVPAATLRAEGDAIIVDASVVRSFGATATKTIVIAFAGTTIGTLTIVTGTVSAFFRARIVLNSNTVFVAGFQHGQGTTFTAGTAAGTGLNFTTTAYDLVITSTCSGAGDSLNIDDLQVRFERPTSKQSFIPGG